jgi:hypothetical protein
VKPAREDAGAPPDFHCFRAPQRGMKPLNQSSRRAARQTPP